MKKDNFIKGRKGEETAKNYLLTNGYKFIESNHRNDAGEIDLVMLDGDWLVFVEVKYKQNDAQGSPEDMLDKRKLNQVYRAAQMYLVTNSVNIAGQFRIDAVCILGNSVKHYRNVYA